MKLISEGFGYATRIKVRKMIEDIFWTNRSICIVNSVFWSFIRKAIRVESEPWCNSRKFKYFWQEKTYSFTCEDMPVFSISKYYSVDFSINISTFTYIYSYYSIIACISQRFHLYITHHEKRISSELYVSVFIRSSARCITIHIYVRIKAGGNSGHLKEWRTKYASF